MQKVLLILPHAPHYREPFLAMLATKCNLTVVANSCKHIGLIPPPSRGNYEYIEPKSLTFGPFSFMLGLSRVVRRKQWDVVCCTFNLRTPQVFLMNLSQYRNEGRWIWWGHIFGTKDSALSKIAQRFFLSRTNFILAHSNRVSERIVSEFGLVNVASFNNTEVLSDHIAYLPKSTSHRSLRVLFIGRPQPRKRIENLVALAKRNRSVEVRLVGPGMPEYIAKMAPSAIGNPRLTVFDAAIGEELQSHVRWCDVVASPGSLGLLVLVAGQFGRAIIVDNASSHGPEVVVATEAEQPFINWAEAEEVDQCIENLIRNGEKLSRLAQNLHQLVKRKYTIENMVEVHTSAFQCNAEHPGTSERAAI